ncbi:MAG: AraC family transcriptional regulator [Clostridia bacterium]|nr:AraC family transcriptional regulator [Clostridia bacterium]
MRRSPHSLYISKEIFKTTHDFSLINAFFHTHEPYYSFPIPEHAHTFYEINVITEGVGKQTFQDKTFDVKKGDVFVLTPYIKHSYTTEDDSFSIFHILINPAFLQRYHDELHSLPGYSLLFETISRVITPKQEMFLHLSEEQMAYLLPEFNELVREQKSPYEGNEIQKIAKTFSVISYLSEALFNATKHKAATPELRTEPISILYTIEYIQTNFSQKIYSKDLAQMANMSHATYQRMFKKLCKCSPQEFIENYRLEKARELLLNASLSVTDIALLCGFFDSSHFSRVFKKHYKELPSNYRKTLQTEKNNSSQA